MYTCMYVYAYAYTDQRTVLMALTVCVYPPVLSSVCLLFRVLSDADIYMNVGPQE